MRSTAGGVVGAGPGATEAHAPESPPLRKPAGTAADPRAPDTLLCEDCGYVIDGLPFSGACPECGRAVARSLPEHRPGTPWQRSRTLRAWTSTAYLLLRHPVRMFDFLRVAPIGVTRLLAINLAAGAMLIVAPWTGTLIGDPARRARGTGGLGEAIVFGWVFLFQVVVVAGLLLALTFVEYCGIRLWAARRDLRLHPAAAAQICAHASIGWVLMGLIPMLALALLFIVGPWLANLLGERFSEAMGAVNRSSWSLLLGKGGLLAGYFAGLMAFETLVYIGVRRCRYANPLGAPG